MLETMTETQYKTRHHELPLIRSGGRIAVAVSGTSEWFRKSVQSHLREGVPVRIDAAAGYAYALWPRDTDREAVLARRLVLRWQGGRLYLDSATGIDGNPVNLGLLFKKSTIEETVAEALSGPTEDTALARSGLHPNVQAQLAATAKQETALRQALLGQVLAANPAAMVLCVKLLGTLFGGCDMEGDMYKQASEKFATARYAPHLRDLLSQLVSSSMPSALRTAAVDFCRHLEETKIEPEWAAEQLSRA
jgi:hypothetical protein